jgi:hypothetical protein
MGRAAGGAGAVAKRLGEPPLWKVCLLIFVLAFAVRLGLVVVRGDYTNLTRTDQCLVALSIVETGVFGNPYVLPTGPTAHYPPAHPFLLSLIYRAFGTGIEAEFAKQALGCFVSSLQYALLPLLGLVIRIPARVFLVAGFAGALLPVKYGSETRGDFEAPDAAVALIVICLLTLHGLRSSRRPGLLAILKGLCWGLAFHIAPQLLPVFVGLLAVEWFLTAREDRARHFLRTAVLVGTTLLTLLPWTIRNYKQFGALFFMRDNLGLEMYISYRDGASARLTYNYPPEPHGVHPVYSRRQALRVQELGEHAYNLEKQRMALEWISSHPGRFVYLTLLRFLYFWFHFTGDWVRDPIFWILTVGGFIGLRALYRVDRQTALLFTTIWLTYPIPYYFFQASTRYRYPIDWIFLLLTCLAVVNLIEKRLRRVEPPIAAG